MPVSIAIFCVFLLAVLSPALHRLLKGGTGPTLALVVAGITMTFGASLPTVAGGGLHLEKYHWIPSLGVELAFRVDGLSLLFLLLIGGIGALILFYASAYLHKHPHEGRFFTILLLFMGSMLGLVASDNLIGMFVFWELTSLASYLLIGFDNEKAQARAAALQALLVTGSGGIALLAGFLLLGQAGGTYSITELLTKGDLIRSHEHYLPILVLVLLGAFTKSAQLPFHFWLPNAMVAPTPVSAYLHSATMVQAGVFLLARLHPVLGGTSVWLGTVTIVGAATMLSGAMLALPQTDLKRLLAYSTVSVLGTLTLLIGQGTETALTAAVIFLVVHSMYKAALFMVAGAVDHETGTRDVRSLSGLIRFMPITAVSAGLAALSMSGFPPLLGFISKELLYEAKLHAPVAAAAITTAGVCANVVMVAVAIIVGIRPFHGRVLVPGDKAHEAPPGLWFGPALLALLGAVTGIWPFFLGQAIVEPAVTAMRGEPTKVSLYLWHGFNEVLLLSIVTVIGGIMVYLARHPIHTLALRLSPLSWYGPDRDYELTLASLKSLASRQTQLLQHGYLRYYILTTVAVAIGFAGFAILRLGIPQIDTSSFTGIHIHEYAVAGLILTAGLVAVSSRSRLAGVTALGIVGYGVALIFALFGAPDLAITQLLVETLTLILFVLVVYHLPRFSPLTGVTHRIRDAIFAAAAGLVVTMLILQAIQVQIADPISPYFAENAPKAQGRNIVNVIIVDFRALDTLGEITVLGIAALGVFALMKLRPAARKEDDLCSKRQCNINTLVGPQSPN